MSTKTKKLVAGIVNGVVIIGSAVATYIVGEVPIWLVSGISVLTFIMTQFDIKLDVKA